MYAKNIHKTKADDVQIIGIWYAASEVFPTVP